MNGTEVDQKESFFKTVAPSALRIVRGRASLIVTCSVLITAFMFVYYPVTFGNAVIRFERGVKRIEFIVPKSFGTCELTFKNEMPVNKLHMGLYVDASGKTKPGGEGKQVEQKLRTIVVKNLIDAKKRTTSNDTKSTKIRIDFHPPSPNELFSPELTSVIIDKKKIALKNFFDENLLHPKPMYVGRKYAREYVSYFLLLYNDEVSNVLIAILAISLIPISLPLMDEVGKLYSKKRFKEHIRKKFSLTSESSDKKIEEAKITYGEGYARKDDYFRFLQVLGPAFGFTLTISSLIAGLHPSLRELQNIGKFFETIQIAMVSTFLGLLLRIIAVCRQRANNRLFVRADGLFLDLQQSEESGTRDDVENG